MAVVGNYLPRQCGIATFTTDLCETLAAEYPEVHCFALPVNDRAEGYAYPERVRFELEQHDLGSYRSAADFLNTNNVDLLCLQHEYGIFGGPAGGHILALLRELRMPVVTTLHTILKEPDADQRRVLEEVMQLSDRVVVMSRRAVQFAHELYGVPEEKIDLIPHGIWDVPFVDPNFYKDQFGLEGKIVVLTFGLLSRNKGIEYVIQAMPRVLERFSNVMYVVLGATHPHVKLWDGESYRLSLERLARKLAVDRNVIFHNRFVSLQELIEFIGAADIYITPYQSPAQIVSGTLACAVGAGKAVLSTPYWYAEELLAEQRGILVPFADPDAIASQILWLLDNEAERHAMRKRAYLLGREMVWTKVARRYMQSFARACEERRKHPRPAFAATTLRQRVTELPELKLDHLENLTDETGVLQHAIFTDPNYAEGYTTDDNARALVLAVLLEQRGVVLSRAHRYQAFLWHAFNRERGRFHNHLSYDRRWLDEIGSEDSHGRALWALGVVLGRSQDRGLQGSAGRLFDLALPAVVHFSSPRAWAYALLGLQEYLRRLSGDRAAQKVRDELLEKLLGLYRRSSTPEWPWFEEVLSYANARLPQALLACGRDLVRPELVEIGLTTLRWLTEVQRCQSDHLVPIGSNGFYRRRGERARFDQQPIEAYATVSACLEAWRIRKESCWYQEAQLAFEWFLGRNDLGLPLYDAATGGCRDGLHPDRVNQNEGAESTLSFLLALEEMRQASHALDPKPHEQPK
ncbi:MAG TPA: glycosyltransferase family 4 protein [Terriglobia bacterium]|nr:glycosyltransferase family 4 protein [Terriglobia bacterium]